jgi:hypothetical protein
LSSGPRGPANATSPTTDELATVLAGLRLGVTVPVTVRLRDGSRATVEVKLGQSPG